MSTWSYLQDLARRGHRSVFTQWVEDDDGSHEAAAARWDEETLAGPPDPDETPYDYDPPCLDCQHLTSEHTRGGNCMLCTCRELRTEEE